MKAKTMIVMNQDIRITQHDSEDYICITDIAKWKNPDANGVIANWMRNRNVLEYLGLWEKLYNSRDYSGVL